MKFLRYSILTLAVFPFIPFFALAHGFGAQYSLPLPASFYMLGGAAALIGSFAVLSLYSAPERASFPRALALPLRSGGVAGKSTGLFFLFLMIGAGAFGSTLPYANPTPILFWIVLLLWFAYMNAIVGGLWERINPFKTIASWTLEGIEPPLRYPERLGYTPAFLFYFLIVSLELFSPLGGNSLFLSVALQGYLIVTIIGSFLFGVEKWFAYGDFFSVFFRIIGAFAPVSLEKDRVLITPPGERLIGVKEGSLSFIVFVFFFLTSTAFDGLRETSIWIDIILALPSRASEYFELISGAALFLSPLIVLGLYLSVAWMMRLFAREEMSLTSLALRFVPSFVPIGIAYSIAHYAGLLFVDVQYLVPLLSDPFGLGWNLFGTAGYEVDIGLVGIETIWYIQLFSIIIGHIAAAYIGHAIARRTFSTKRAVIMSQLPLLLIMVFYTVSGLWILSEPYGAPTF